MSALTLIRQLAESQTSKFVVQLRYDDGDWHDDGDRYKYDTFEQAVQVYRDFVKLRPHHEPGVSFRIVNRITTVEEVDVTPL